MSKENVTGKTVKEYFANGGLFQFEHCNPYSTHWFSVDVDFSHDECENDETQFDIRAYDMLELNELFEGFIKENNFKNVQITSITVVKWAPTEDGLYDDGDDED